MLELLLALTGALVLPFVTAWLTLVSNVVIAAGIAGAELFLRVTQRRAPASPGNAGAWPGRRTRTYALRIGACASLITIVGGICAVTMGNTLATLVIHRALRGYEHEFTLDAKQTTFWKGTIAVSDLKLVRNLEDGRRTDVTIDGAVFELSWPSLLGGKIQFSRVEIEGVYGKYASSNNGRRRTAPWPFVIEELSVKDLDVTFLWVDRCPDAEEHSAHLEIDRLKSLHLDSRHWLLSFLVRTEVEARLDQKTLRIRHTSETSSWEIGAVSMPILQGLASGWLCQLPDRGAAGVRCDFAHAQNGDWEVDVKASLDPFEGPSADKPRSRLMASAAKAVDKVAKPRVHLHFRIDSERMEGVTSLTDEGIDKILIRSNDSESK